jgi:hypothetical protein
MQAAFAIFTGMIVVVAGAVLFATMKQQPFPVRVTTEALQRLGRADRGVDPLAAVERDAIESFLARHQRATLADARLYQPENLTGLLPAHRTMAQRILATPPRLTEEAVARSREVQAILARARQPPRTPPLPVLGLMVVFAVLLTTGLASLLTAVTVRGVSARVLGFDYVEGDGSTASRLRLLARSTIAWSPLLLAALASAWPGYQGPAALVAAMAIAFVALAAGAAYAIVRPSRGLQDRLAGTWIVPR